MSRFWDTLRQTHAILLIGVMTTGLGTNTTLAQDLDLAPVPPAPDLGERTSLQVLMEQLDRETERISSAPPRANADQLDRGCVQAVVDVRAITRELLSGLPLTESSDSERVLIALTLAAHREQIDELIRSCLKLPHEDGRRESILDQLGEFHLRAAELSDRLKAGEPLDRVLAWQFGPLTAVAEQMQNPRARSHWPPAGSVRIPVGLFDGPTADPSEAAVEPSLLDTRRRVRESATLREDTRHEILAVLETVSTLSSPEHRWWRIRALEHIQDALAFTDQLSEADWLGDEDRQTYENRLHRAIVRWQTPQTAAAGESDLRRLDVTRRAIERANILAEGRFKLSAFRAVLLAIDEELDDHASTGTGGKRLESGIVVLDQLIAYRRLKDVKTLPMPVRRLYVKLTKEYEQAERAMLTGFRALAEHPHAPADPGFISLIAAQREFLESLQRIQKLPEWREKMMFLAPGHGAEIDERALRFCERLLKPGERPDASRLADQFQQQLDLFFRLPFEDEMRRGDQSAREATNNRHLEVIDVLDDARHEWATSWATGGEGGETTEHLLLLSRLMHALADDASFDNADVLNQWTAWELRPTILERSRRRLRQHLAQAANEARRARWEQLERRLTLIDREASPARLAGRLVRILGSALEGFPPDASSLMGQCVYPPSDDAWFGNRRTDLALFCRYAIELEYAPTRDDDELTDSLEEYVRALARDLMMDLGERKVGW